ncbi:MAG TPA: histidinol dehydrogenase [Gemmataceae bacterium]|jgi:histidinol dehydrogenase|nr:histidinol dehydrogenase [Gemmataceae bacterium]
MATIKLRRIDGNDPKSSRQLSDLRRQISHQGEVVSPRSRELTRKVFGEALPPVRAVERICTDVQKDGLSAVLHYTEQFDKVKLKPGDIRVPVAELQAAHAAADPDFLDTVRNIRQNVLSFQMGLLHTDAILSVSGSHELQLRYRPLRRVGICVPGGAASYPSTLLMTVCPAQAAGVKELAVVMPPTQYGAYNPDLLAVCYELGVTEVYRIGGAQAVAALAYGVEGLPPVNMIVGPGNLYVVLAKRHVLGQVAIDCLAGPSEVIVVADESAQPDYVAADLIAQAEHSPGVSILVTWYPELLNEAADSLARQLSKLSRGNLARESLERYGAFILARNFDEAVNVTNQLAPEHLHIQTRDPEAFADRIESAGAMFLGYYTPVALGDYAAGPSHVLPTGGTARFTSGLTANDFLRCSSVMSFTLRGMKHLAEDVVRLAEKEGLTGHAHSVSIRMSETKLPARPPKKAVKSST